MKDCQGFLDFCEKHTPDYIDNLLSDILDAAAEDKNTDRIYIASVTKFDYLNIIVSGTVTLENGTEIVFQIEDGNRNGTVILEWGENADFFKEPSPTKKFFVPRDPDLKNTKPGMYKVYLEWRKQEWFQEKESSLNYDCFVEPSDRTYSYYKDWAEKKGLIIETDNLDRVF